MESVHKRLHEFWRDNILPFRDTDATVLIVTHAGLVGKLRKNLLGQGYTVHPSLQYRSGNARILELRNCSITEIFIPKTGPGKFIRIGEWEHLCSAYDLRDTMVELADSTGN